MGEAFIDGLFLRSPANLEPKNPYNLRMDCAMICRFIDFEVSEPSNRLNRVFHEKENSYLHG